MSTGVRVGPNFVYPISPKGKNYEPTTLEGFVPKKEIFVVSKNKSASAVCEPVIDSASWAILGLKPLISV